MQILLCVYTGLHKNTFVFIYFNCLGPGAAGARQTDPTLNRQTVNLAELKGHVVVVYHVTIVAIGHGMLKKF